MADSESQAEAGQKTEKVCWECGRTFTTSMEVCPDDGARLIDTDVGDQDDPLVGTVFDGRFQIRKKLGEGGMGAVYSARRLDFETDVALKLLKVDFTSHEGIRKRFMYEARVISNLKHPHAIQVFDFGQTSEGHVYMVMELLEGESLADRLAYRFVTYREVFDIIPPICGVLGEAHAHDVIHRDLKPENIFLLEVDGNEEFPKLLDFGIAKHKRAETMTKSGTLWGTPAYMSPEQAKGTSVGPAADIYGVGIMLFELITGNLPFSASTQMGYAVKHIKQPVRPPSSIPGLDSIPDRLDELIVRMLAKSPEERPESMEQVATQLEEIGDELFDDELLDTTPAKEVDAIRLQKWIDEAPDAGEEAFAETLHGDEEAESLGETAVFAEQQDQGRDVGLADTAALAGTADFESPTRKVESPEEYDREIPADEQGSGRQRQLEETRDAESVSEQGEPEGEESGGRDAAATVALREERKPTELAARTGIEEPDHSYRRVGVVGGVVALAVLFGVVGLLMYDGGSEPAPDTQSGEQTTGAPAQHQSAEPRQPAPGTSEASVAATTRAAGVILEAHGIVQAIDPDEVDEEDIAGDNFDFLYESSPEQPADDPPASGGDDYQPGGDADDSDRLREALEETF